MQRGSYSDWTSHYLERIQITFKTIRPPAGTQTTVESKEIHFIPQHNSWAEYRYKRLLRTFDNPRQFYCLQDQTTSNNKIGNDKHKDGETAATSETSRDSWDLSWDCEARDAALAQTITEAVAREVAKAHAHYQAILNEKSASTLQISLKISSGANGFKVMDPFDWTNLSTRDGNCGQKRLDSPLMPWREIQRKPRFPTSIIGSMERECDTLSHGKTARPSSASQHMMN